MMREASFGFRVNLDVKPPTMTPRNLEEITVGFGVKIFCRGFGILGSGRREARFFEKYGYRIQGVRQGFTGGVQGLWRAL